MTSPLAPPPPTGGPLDGWLYLLWRKITAAGQILWSSISPGTSADVAAAVTDATGSPGSLVFSGNPTLDGAVINGKLTVGVSAPTFTNPLTVYASSGNAAGMVGIGDGVGAQMVAIRVSNDASQPQIIMQKRRGTWAVPLAVASNDLTGNVAFQAYGGSNVRTLGSIGCYVDTFTSDSNISSYLTIGVSSSGSAAQTENLRIAQDGTTTLGGLSTSPALKVIPDATPSTQRGVEITAGAAAGNPTIGVSGGKLAVSAAVVLSQGTLLETSVALTNGAAAAAGTLLNAPAAGNPTKWIPINDNGTTRYIPAW